MNNKSRKFTWGFSSMRFISMVFCSFLFSFLFSSQFSPFSSPLTHRFQSPSAYLQIIIHLSKTLTFLDLNLTSFNRTKQCLVWESWKGLILTHSVTDLSFISGLRKVVGNNSLKGHFFFLSSIGQAPFR